MTVEQASFSVELRRHRLAASLSQEELAEQAGLASKAISALERGERRRPYPHSVRVLADALGLQGEDRATFVMAAAGNSPDRFGQAPPRIMSVLGNLPPPATSFVGRKVETTTLKRLMRAERLVTLTGVGGCGKSRLALHVAAQVGKRFADGVWFVELGKLADPAMVPSTVAQVLGVNTDGDRQIKESLRAHLESRQILLLLDSCEHLVDVCAELIAMLLRACPRLRVLVTSQQPLRVSEEVTWSVPPLALPEADVSSLADLAHTDAVQFFVKRARAVKPDFTLNDANVADVTAICRRLDGLPLALELAAARMRGFSPTELLMRLGRPLAVLRDGARDMPARQQTMRATVEWSYALLSSQEQALFNRLSIFTGGWSLQGAEAIGAGDAIARENVADLIAGLVDKSLVQVEQVEDGTTWYVQLETLRQFGREALDAQAELDVLQRRHASYYVSLAEQADHGLIGPDALIWFDRLEREDDNIRSALRWCVKQQLHESRDVADDAREIGLRLAGNLRWFWLFHDHHREGLTTVDQFLFQLPTMQTPARAMALYTAGILTGMLNDLMRSRALLTECVALHRATHNVPQLAISLATLGWALWRSGEEQHAAEVLAESLALARADGDAWSIAIALMHGVFRVANRPIAEQTTERSQALAHGAEALALFEQTEDRLNSAVLRMHLGHIAFQDGDFPRSRAAFRACLPMLEAFGWRFAVAETLVRLADTVRAQGEDEEAAAHYHAALAAYHELGDQWLPVISWVHAKLAVLELDRRDWVAARGHATEILMIARTHDLGRVPPFMGAPLPLALEVLATLAMIHGDVHQSARLVGAAARERERLEYPLTTLEQDTLEHRLVSGRQLLSPTEWDQAWNEGRHSTRAEAIFKALDSA